MISVGRNLNVNKFTDEPKTKVYPKTAEMQFLSEFLGIKESELIQKPTLQLNWNFRKYQNFYICLLSLVLVWLHLFSLLFSLLYSFRLLFLLFHRAFLKYPKRINASLLILFALLFADIFLSIILFSLIIGYLFDIFVI